MQDSEFMIGKFWAGKDILKNNLADTNVRWMYTYVPGDLHVYIFPFGVLQYCPFLSCKCGDREQNLEAGPCKRAFAGPTEGWALFSGTLLCSKMSQHHPAGARALFLRHAKCASTIPCGEHCRR